MGMGQFKTWLECIEVNRFDEATVNMMLQEAPRTCFTGPFPPDLAFLDGRFVGLGFENLGIDQQKHNDLLRALSGTGVAVPGTPHRLRFVYPYAVIEPVDGSEKATLPKWWKQAVLVVVDQVVPTWVGKRVRPQQIAGFNLQGYKDVGEGLVPANTP
jgi:hypothetical protein